jgi:hypothetical protein
MRRSKIAAVLATMTLASAAAVVEAPMASANAYGCHDDVCVSVPGHGNYVGKVRVYLTLGPNQSLTGHFDILRAGTLVLHGPTRSLSNGSHVHSHTWSDAYAFNRDLTPGDKICGKFVVGGSTLDAACETVG